MAYDETLAERIRRSLGEKAPFTEKKMFGGIAFMVRGNMCVGVLGESIMARVGANQYVEMLEREHVRPMDFTGKPMTGYVYVDPEGLVKTSDVQDVIARCLEFNATLPAK